MLRPHRAGFFSWSAALKTSTQLRSPRLLLTRHSQSGAWETAQRQPALTLLAPFPLSWRAVLVPSTAAAVSSRVRFPFAALRATVRSCFLAHTLLSPGKTRGVRIGLASRRALPPPPSRASTLSSVWASAAWPSFAGSSAGTANHRHSVSRIETRGSLWALFFCPQLPAERNVAALRCPIQATDPAADIGIQIRHRCRHYRYSRTRTPGLQRVRRDQRAGSSARRGVAGNRFPKSFQPSKAAITMPTSAQAPEGTYSTTLDFDLGRAPKNGIDLWTKAYVSIRQSAQ